MITRRKIGSVLTQSPADRLAEYLSVFTTKLIYCIITLGFLYLLFNYLVLNIINFMIENITFGELIKADNTYFRLSMALVMLITGFSIMKGSLRKK